MICQECGMSVYPDNSYHPYAACLMFKGCEDGSIVTANLDAVVAKGAQYDSGFDDLADRACAAEARVKELEAALRELQAACIESQDLYYASMCTKALGSTAETVERLKPREFDLESHQGFYTETQGTEE